MSEPLGTRGARRVYYWGGGLFIAAGLCSVMGFVLLGASSIVMTGLLLQLVALPLSAVAVLVVAVGSGEGGSVVARQPVGVAAMGLYALLPIFGAIAPMLGGMIDLGWMPLTLGAAQLAAGVIAVIAILRARVVPRMLLWVPPLVVVVDALAFTVLLWSWSTQDGGSELAGAVSRATYIFEAFAPLGFGVIAIVLAARAARTARVTRDQVPA